MPAESLTGQQLEYWRTTHWVGIKIADLMAHNIGRGNENYVTIIVYENFDPPILFADHKANRLFAHQFFGHGRLVSSDLLVKCYRFGRQPRLVERGQNKQHECDDDTRHARS